MSEFSLNENKAVEDGRKKIKAQGYMFEMSEFNRRCVGGNGIKIKRISIVIFKKCLGIVNQKIWAMLKNKK